MQKHYLIYVGAVVIILVTVIGGISVFSSSTNAEADDSFVLTQFDAPDENDERQEDLDQQVDLLEEVIVDVKGEVDRPGIYQLQTNQRVDDAIRLAGGLTDEANGNGVNFAQKVSDEMVIYVPHEDEEETMPLMDEGVDMNDGGAVDINTADESALQELPGIGPAKAAAIVQYREENGSFSEPGDIQNVGGIGEKSFQQLEDQITVH